MKDDRPQVNFRMRAVLRKQVADYALDNGISFTEAAHDLLVAALDKNEERRVILRELAVFTAARLADLDEPVEGQSAPE